MIKKYISVRFLIVVVVVGLLSTSNFNLPVPVNDNSLQHLKVALADEGGEIIEGGELPEVTCYGSSTYKEGGSGFVTITWLSIWFEDVYNPTESELEEMQEDLSENRAQRQITVTQMPDISSWSAGGVSGVDLGVWNAAANANYGETNSYNYVSYQTDACVKEFYDHCTHLPPGEAYTYL